MGMKKSVLEAGTAILDDLFGTAAKAAKPADYRVPISSDTLDAGRRTTMFGERTEALKPIAEVQPKTATAEDIVQGFNLIDESDVGGTPESALRSYISRTGLDENKVGEALGLTGVETADDAVGILGQYDLNLWRVQKREQAVAAAKLQRIDELKVNIRPSGRVQFESIPRANDMGKTEAARGTELRQAEIRKQQAKLTRYTPETAAREARNPLVPQTFSPENVSSPQAAYSWAKQHFFKFLEEYKTPEGQRRSQYREHYKTPAVLNLTDGTQLRLYNPIKFREWIRAADAMSYNFNADDVYNYVTQLDIPEEYVAQFNPFETKTWFKFQNEVIQPLRDRMDEEEIVLSRIGDEEGIGPEELIVEAANIKNIQTTVDDINLVRAFYKTNQFMMGKKTEARQIVENGLARFYGNRNFEYYDGSTDAFLAALDSTTADYSRLKTSRWERSAKYALKAIDDVAKGGVDTPWGTKQPYLITVDDLARIEADKIAWTNKIQMDDESAASRIHEQDSLFDRSSQPSATGSFLGSGTDTAFARSGSYSLSEPRRLPEVIPVAADSPRAASIKKERTARNDLAAGYTGQSERLDPDWNALKTKGITDFEWGEHLQPGQGGAQDIEASQQFADAALAHLDAFDDAEYGVDPKWETPTWDELLTASYIKSGGTNAGMNAKAIDVSEMALALSPEEYTRYWFEQFGSANTAARLVNLFPTSIDAPRLVTGMDVNMSQRVNILRLNTPEDYNSFVGELKAMRSSNPDTSGLPMEFFSSFEDNKQFYEETGLKIAKHVTPESRDAIWSGLVVTRNAIAERSALPSKGPVDELINRVILGKLLHVGTTLTDALAGRPTLQMRDAMLDWDLSANNSAELATKVYAMAQANYGQIYGEVFDNLTVQQTAELIREADPYTATLLVDGWGVANKAVQITRYKLDAAKRKFIRTMQTVEEETKPVTKRVPGGRDQAMGGA